MQILIMYVQQLLQLTNALDTKVRQFINKNRIMSNKPFIIINI